MLVVVVSPGRGCELKSLHFQVFDEGVPRRNPLTPRGHGTPPLA
jgi:hypothetical protein